MKKSILIISMAIFTIACQDKEVKNNPQVEESKTEEVVENKVQPLLFNGASSDLYYLSEEAIIATLNEDDAMRLQKAIQIISNNCAAYTEEGDIDKDKWNADYLKQIDKKSVSEVSELAVSILKAEQQAQLDRINAELGKIKSPKSESEKERYESFQQELTEAQAMPITLDDYVYSEECFL